MKRVILAVAMVMMTMMLSGCFFADLPPDIDGFRGIKWGTNISKMNGFSKLGTNPSFGGIDLYSRDNDPLTMGSAKLDSILYWCWQGKFSEASIDSSGRINFESVLAISKEKFGEPFKENRYIEKYYWFNSTTSVRLEYNQVSDKGSMSFSSKEIAKDQLEYSKIKAREGAATSF